MCLFSAVRCTSHSRVLFPKKISLFLDHGTVVNGIFEYQMQKNAENMQEKLESRRNAKRICMRVCACVCVRV